jgi:hypothetical protein
MYFLAGSVGSSVLDLISSLKESFSSSSSSSSSSTGTGFKPRPPAFDWEQVTGTGVSSTTASGSTSSSVSSSMMDALLAAQSQGGGDPSSTVLAALDADGNGSVSKGEFEKAFGSDTDKADALFTKLDTDQDGAVTAKEIAAGLGQVRQRHQDTTMSTIASSLAGAGGVTATNVGYADTSTTQTMLRSSGQTASDSNVFTQLVRRQMQMVKWTQNGQSLSLNV